MATIRAGQKGFADVCSMAKSKRRKILDLFKSIPWVKAGNTEKKVISHDLFIEAGLSIALVNGYSDVIYASKIIADMGYKINNSGGLKIYKSKLKPNGDKVRNDLVANKMAMVLLVDNQKLKVNEIMGLVNVEQDTASFIKKLFDKNNYQICEMVKEDPFKNDPTVTYKELTDEELMEAVHNSRVK